MPAFCQCTSHSVWPATSWLTILFSESVIEIFYKMILNYLCSLHSYILRSISSLSHPVLTSINTFTPSSVSRALFLAALVFCPSLLPPSIPPSPSTFPRSALSPACLSASLILGAVLMGASETSASTAGLQSPSQHCKWRTSGGGGGGGVSVLIP